MPFVKGDTRINKGGRPAGALNRSTEQAKLAVSRLANQGLDALREDLEKIRKNDPLEAAKIYLKLIEYIVPKKTALEISGELNQRIQQVTIQIQNGNTDTHRNDTNISESSR